MPELGEFEAMADPIFVAGFYEMEEVVDTSASERRQLYRTLAYQKPAWAPLSRKMFDEKLRARRRSYRRLPPSSRSTYWRE